MKPNDPQWEIDCASMVSLLASKLEPPEMMELLRLWFNDPPGGPLWDALSAKVREVCPGDKLPGDSEDDDEEETE